MSKIKQLINNLCPDGVEFKEIESLCETCTPKLKVKKENYRDKGTYPVIDQGQNFIGGYTDEEGAFDNGEYIIFGDHTCTLKFVNFAFVQGADGIKILKANEKIIIPKFLYYCMANVNVTSSYNRHWSKIKIIKIPVPPLEVQREIVRILDLFTNLTAELTAELTARKKQYEYYRDKLLNFGDDVKRKTLGEVLKIRNGKDYKHLDEGNVPVYGSGGVIAHVNKYSYDKPSVLIPRKGSVNKLYYVDMPFWNVDTIFYTEINNEVVEAKYIFYVLQKEHLEKLNIAGGVPSLTQSALNKIKIPVPPIDTQIKIVNILDKFEKLCNSLIEGIPAEINARKKQYEYYRDKLLTFKEFKEGEK